MEEDEHHHHHHHHQTESPQTPSKSPPIISTVTVAATAPPPLTLALPIQQPHPPSSATPSSGGREDCWSEGATSVLIDAWGERYMELSRGNLKQKHWKEVADIVSSREDYSKTPKTDIQCKNRIDTVKKKYKLEKSKGFPSSWPFFHRLDRLIGPSATVSPASTSNSAASKSVPVGIPVGLRPLPLPYHHLHSANQIRPINPNHSINPNHNYPSPVFHKFTPNPNFNHNHHLINNGKQHPQQFRRGPPPPPPPPAPESESDQEDGWSGDSADSLPPKVGMGTGMRKRSREEVKKGKGKGKGRDKREWGRSVRELTRAILKFGEAYEAAESAKLQQVVEMEKQRMQFAKELELQRMKFLMKTQLELSQLNDSPVGNGNGNHSGGSSGRRGGVSGGGGGGVEITNNNHVRVNENHVNLADSDSS